MLSKSLQNLEPTFYVDIVFGQKIDPSDRGALAQSTDKQQQTRMSHFHANQNIKLDILHFRASWFNVSDFSLEILKKRYSKLK